MDSASRSGLKRPIEWVGVAVMTLKVGMDIRLSGEGGVVGKEGVTLGKGDRTGLSAGLQVQISSGLPIIGEDGMMTTGTGMEFDLPGT